MKLAGWILEQLDFFRMNSGSFETRIKNFLLIHQKSGVVNNWKIADIADACSVGESAARQTLFKFKKQGLIDVVASGSGGQMGKGTELNTYILGDKFCE